VAFLCACASCVTKIEWLPSTALLVAVAVKTSFWLVVALMEMKSLLSFRSSKAAFTLVSAYLTAAKPEIKASFLLIFLLIASARGAFSASTRLWVSAVISMPEPLPSLLMMPALAPVLVVLVVVLLVELVPLVLDVLLVVLGVVDEVDEDTEVTMGVD